MRVVNGILIVILSLVVLYLVLDLQIDLIVLETNYNYFTELFLDFIGCFSVISLGVGSTWVFED